VPSFAGILAFAPPGFFAVWPFAGVLAFAPPDYFIVGPFVVRFLVFPASVAT